MHLVQIIMLIVILSWVLSELVKIPLEVLRIMEIDIFQKRKNLTPSPNYARFTLKPLFKPHKKAC